MYFQLKKSKIYSLNTYCRVTSIELEGKALGCVDDDPVFTIDSRPEVCEDVLYKKLFRLHSVCSLILDTIPLLVTAASELVIFNVLIKLLLPAFNIKNQSHENFIELFRKIFTVRARNRMLSSEISCSVIPHNYHLPIPHVCNAIADTQLPSRYIVEVKRSRYPRTVVVELCDCWVICLCNITVSGLGRMVTIHSYQIFHISCRVEWKTPMETRHIAYADDNIKINIKFIQYLIENRYLIASALA